MVLPSPGGADQPHQSGVRLGNRQPSKNRKLAVWPGGMVLFRQSTPTALCDSGCTPRLPDFENWSQNKSGEFHQRPAGHPSQCETSVPPSCVAASTNSPAMGSSGERLVLLIANPASPFAVRYSFRSPSFSLFTPAPRLSSFVFTGLAIENAMPTSAGTRPGLVTR